MNTSTVSTPTAGGSLSRKTLRRSFLQLSALAGAGLFLASSLAAAAEPPAAKAPGDILDVFKARRSVRHFKPDAVPEANLRRILDAARTAPTSGNQQPWKFLVVRDPARIAALKEGTVRRFAGLTDPTKPLTDEQKKNLDDLRKRIDGYFSAPVMVVVLTDNKSTYPDYNHWDGPLAAGYLMLAARALGYGTVFVTDAIPDEVTMHVLNIPDRYTRVCITPLGVPAAWPDSPAKKPLDDFIANESL